MVNVRTQFTKHTAIPMAIAIATGLILLALGSLVDMFAIGAIVCLTAMAYCFYLLRLLDQKEDKSSAGKIYKEIYSHIENLQRIIEESSFRLQECEEIVGLRFYENSRGGSVADLATMRRLIASVKKRRDEIIRLMNSNKSKHLVEARQLTRQEITIKEDALNCVLDAAPIPPIAPEILAEYVGKVMDRIEKDLRTEKREVA